MADIEKTIVKARYWWFVLYPESAPADWVDFLQSTGLQFCVSPLHDSDINPDGDPKKSHYHIILAYNGPTTFSNVKKNITDTLGQPHPQYLQAVKGAYRYLTHKDNPEKYQYSESDIRAFGGFNISDFADLTMSEEDRLYDAIETVIDDLGILEYNSLIKYLRCRGLFELVSFARRHTFHIDSYIKSARHSTQSIETDENGNVFVVNNSSGEIVKLSSGILAGGDSDDSQNTTGTLDNGTV